ncbi:MAG: hypothetical protein L0Y77_03445 [Chlorobi bacterium]|nr:hypothetical protein [Chlorobiota bacterium]
MNTLKNFTHKFGLTIVLFIGFCLVGCKSDGVGVTEQLGDKPQGNFQFSHYHSLGSVNTGVLSIETVKVLMKDIQLNVANSSNTHNFKVGPVVIVQTPNNSSRLIYIGHEIIPEGTYDKIHFKIHKPGGNETPPDPEFAEGNSRYSIIVKGTYDNESFVYKYDKSAVQMLTFPNNLIVTSTLTNVTLNIRSFLWFYDENHSYMNPMNPNNKQKIDRNIKENIRGNFRVFQDNDGNGEPD